MCTGPHRVHIFVFVSVVANHFVVANFRLRRVTVRGTRKVFHVAAIHAAHLRRPRCCRSEPTERSAPRAKPKQSLAPATAPYNDCYIDCFNNECYIDCYNDENMTGCCKNAWLTSRSLAASSSSLSASAFAVAACVLSFLVSGCRYWPWRPIITCTDMRM